MKYHYTIHDRLEKIAADGFIRPATVGVPHGERPAVWFSMRPTWEPTATKMTEARRRCTWNEMLKHVPVRIAVRDEAALLGWAGFKRESGILPENAKALYHRAVAQGASPRHWFVSFENVLEKDWLHVDVFENGKWRLYFAREENPWKANVQLN